jgi:CubicO group peptidase (beta-lactamase class C family)/D-alanyl-D-alanine dipeptidase
MADILRHWSSCFILLPWAVSCGGASGDIEPRRDYAAVAELLEPFIEWHMEVKEIPAVSIALVDDQEIVWARGFGYADPGDSTPATANTVYRVGSVSKLFTDMAVMRLVQHGELELDAPVTTYLPDFSPENHYDKPITLRQLMSHRAGLVREPPVGNYFDDTEPSLPAMVASLNSTTLVYEPEARIKYSNAGVATVGYVLERTQGVPFAKYVKDAVLTPFGMRRSAFEPEPQLIEDLAAAQMWTYDGRSFEAPTFQLGMAPAGSMYSTVIDLGGFMSVLFAGSTRDGTAVVGQETLAAMWQPQFAPAGATNGYGLGFNVGLLDGHRRIGHGGAIYGFATELALLPDEKVGTIVVATKDGANAVTDLIADLALRSMLAVREHQPLPTPRRTLPVPHERIRALVGEYPVGDAGIEFLELNGRLHGLLYRGGIAFELRQWGDTLVVDGPLDQGGTVVLLQDGRIVIGRDTLRQASSRPPPAVPDSWRGLIGEYGWDHNTLFILERRGQLHALIEWFFFYPLQEVSPDVFAFPDFGLYHGERLLFNRDSTGRATAVEAASVVFERRPVGLDEGTFQIEPVRPVEELRQEALAASPAPEQGEFREPDLVEVTELDPTIKLDIRYASTDNFMGAVFYQQPRAFLQRPAAEAVVRAHRALREYGYGLLIHDAYRPWYVTKMFWDATPEDKKIFVANPASGSRHNRGCAVDLTLYDSRTGEPIQMVGTYDEMTERSYPAYPGGTSRQRWHRDLLRRVMEAEGFSVYEFEWWHFDYKDWAAYPILNSEIDE